MIPLITTKLSPPPMRPECVARTYLLERIAAGLRHRRPLTLISAPAGYGKTTLVSAWLQAANHKAAWLGLDEGDNDPLQFLQYLVAALQRVERGLGQTVQGLLDGPHTPQVPHLLALLVNEIAAFPEQLIIVLDDYHCIANPKVHAAVSFLLEHQPANLHLVILTRSDPPLPIPRLRARGQLTELRATDLRFTLAEAALFLQRMGVELRNEEVEAIEQRVEGWAAGIQLVALALQQTADEPQAAAEFIRTFTGSHHFVVEYLVEEVLRRQPLALQDFLLRTCILERMCGELCDAVVAIPSPPGRGQGEGASLLSPYELGAGEEPSPCPLPAPLREREARGEGIAGQSTLEHLQRSNLFIVSLDHEQHWYRYHPLFADVLRARLRGQLAPDEIAGLHRRASCWYWQNGALAEAVEHAFAGPDFELAAEILEAAAKSSMMQGNLSSLLRWIDRLPPEWLKARLRLRVYQAWALFLGGQANLARQFLNEARGDLLAQPACPDLRALRGELASMLAIISTADRDPAAIMELVQEAQEYLPESDLTSRARATHVLGTLHNVLGDTRQSLPVFEQALQLALTAHNFFLASSILETIASTHIHCGRLRQATRVFQELVDLGSRESAVPRPFAGNGYLGLAEILLEQERLEKAAHCAQQGMELIRQGGIGYNLLSAWCVQARLHMALGDPGGALEALYQAEQVPVLTHSSPWTVYLAAYEVRWHLAQGDAHQARQWAFHLPGLGLESLPRVVREVHRVTQARVHLALGEPQAVLAIAAEELPAVEAAGRMARVIELNLFKALALEALGNRPSAANALGLALDLAEPEGYVRLFLEAGPAARRMLEAARPEAASPRQAYIDRLMPPVAPAPAQPDETPPGPAPVTERERDVLRLLAAGYSNQEIAAQLVLTLNTVKKHTSNLYAKLGVTSRTQAIARARELGIL